MLGTAFRPSAEISFYSVKVIRRGVATRQRRGKTAWPLSLRRFGWGSQMAARAQRIRGGALMTAGL
jgi:hypothetical protein